MKRLLTLVLSCLVAAGCAESVSNSDVTPASETSQGTPLVKTQEEVPELAAQPDWLQVSSPSKVDKCKVEDGLPREVLAAGRGSLYNGVPARGPVGFPWTPSYFFPTEGKITFLMLLVSFEDSVKFTDSPAAYWAPQAAEMSAWADFWSQGKLAFDVRYTAEWIDLPYKSSEAPAKDAELASDIFSRLPGEIIIEEIDSVFIQWAEGIQAGSRSRFSMALNSIDALDNSGLDFGQTVLATDFGFYQNDYEARRDNIWGQLVHDSLHEMNMNLHGPGNGWGTGVGQSYRPNQAGGVSYAISAWEQFLVGWMDDSQVHCVSPSDLENEQSLILTPLEIYGGERRALVVPITVSDVLVVESRRPIGYSNWRPENTGLLAYTVNPQVSVQKDHIDQDCGNDPTHTKWAYYLFPDQEIQEASGWCGAMGGQFFPAVVNVGETITHNGVRVELVYSTDDQDYVRVTKVGPSDPPPGGYPALGPPTSGGGWWNNCDALECPLLLPNPPENFGYLVATEETRVPVFESCDELFMESGFRNGIAASREFRDKAGAEVAILVSTHWYAKNRSLDTNLDGILCSCQAPESSNTTSENSDDGDKCVTVQLAGMDEREKNGPQVELPAIAENSNHGKPVNDPNRIGPPSCKGLASNGMDQGIAGSFELRKAAGAPSAMVSTQWYKKLFLLDVNNDGVICSPEAPE